MSGLKGASNENCWAFICYETTTGVKFADNLQKSLKKINVNTFIAKNDLIEGDRDEMKTRDSILRSCPVFIFIVTTVSLHSDEVLREVNESLNYGKYIIVCLHNSTSVTSFKEKFPKLANVQRIYFEDECELANRITSNHPQYNKIIQLNQKDDTDLKANLEYDTGLIVAPIWSLKKISNNDRRGHVIFYLKNKTGTDINLCGYRMIRISPNGERDIYYNGYACAESDFKKWVSGLHFELPLRNYDDNTIHWDDVDIIKTYGINKPGLWKTEIQIAYLENGSSDISFSKGETELEYV